MANTEEAAAQGPPGDHGQDSPGGWLILPGAVEGASRAEVRALFAKSCGELPAHGHIAVLFRNRTRGLIDWIRWRIGRGGEGYRTARPLATLSLDSMCESLRECGYVSVMKFAVSPSDHGLRDVRPISRRNRWTAPAFLLVARKPQGIGGSVLERIIQTVDEMVGPGRGDGFGRVLGVTNSARGKSIAMVQCNDAQVVVRIARSEIMRADEARSFDVLREVQSTSEVSALVPRPIVSGSVAGFPFFAQSHVLGVPLSTALRDANRTEFLRQVDAVLRGLNPGLPESSATGLDDLPGPAVGEPMVGFVLKHVDDPVLRERFRALIENSLQGAVSRRGIVHGDFGTGNILVARGRITGIIDWEAARTNAPPVLDAFNYLDSAHRCCRRGLSIIDTLPMLANGEWPVPEEACFLEDHLRRSGIDLRYRRGFALLYLVFHIGPQLRFASSEEGTKQRLAEVLRRV